MDKEQKRIYDRQYKLRKSGEVTPECIICGNRITGKNLSKYCGRVFVVGTKKYDKTTCAYKARAKMHLGYNKKRNVYFNERKSRLLKTSPEFLYRSYGYNSKYYKREFTITFEEFKTFWGKPCYYCGEIVETVKLDRLDNKVGYTSINVVQCCTECNFAKGSKLSKEEFIKLAIRIAKNQEKKET